MTFTLQNIIGMLVGVGFKAPNDIQADLKHPLAMNNIGKSALLIKYHSSSVSEIWGQDNEPSDLIANAPIPCAVLCGALLLRFVIRLCNFNYIGLPLMIYTFLITNNKNKLAELDNIRTISVCAQSELKARQSLNGLPLVFVSQSVTGRVL